MNPKVDEYLSEGCGRCPLGGTPDCKVLNWPEALVKLRAIALDCGLNEELKWGVPCYTFQGKNVAMISAFNEFCSLSFFKGVLLKDEQGLLHAPGEHSQAVRLFKFTGGKEVSDLRTVLKAYLFEAIEVEKAGLKVEFKKNPEPIPEELEEKFAEDPVFRAAFEELTPGRQRGYILHFSKPKQSKTRRSRIQKCEQDILNGIGMHDRYKSGRK